LAVREAAEEASMFKIMLPPGTREHARLRFALVTIARRA
jgi:hypothetical protein